MNNNDEASADPLRGASTTTSSSSSSGRITKDKETEVEFCRLKKLVPAISKKQTVSKLDVILEAIRYIDQLQDQLVEQINDNRISVAAAAMLVGKENKASVADAAMLKALQKARQK